MDLDMILSTLYCLRMLSLLLHPASHLVASLLPSPARNTPRGLTQPLSIINPRQSLKAPNLPIAIIIPTSSSATYSHPHPPNRLPHPRPRSKEDGEKKRNVPIQPTPKPAINDSRRCGWRDFLNTPRWRSYSRLDRRRRRLRLLLRRGG